MVVECSENINENEMIYNGTLNKYKNICSSCESSSCAVYIVLFSVFLAINIGLGVAFLYFYWYSKNEVVTNINPGTEINL